MSSKSQFETSERGHAAVGRESPFDDHTDILLSMQDIVGRKWHPVLLYTLCSGGPMGFSALKDHTSGISSKMLSESLDRLEARGLVVREVVSEQPFRVEYSLTDPGESLAPLVTELARWGSDHSAVLDGDESREPRTTPAEDSHSRPGSWERHR